MEPKITVGFVNCNRLFYLKSCVKSFLECSHDYKNKQLIVVDNASVEPGTKEFLDELDKQGFEVIQNNKRDPSNEFAKALNIISECSKGDFIIPLQGDMQFILKNGWLHEFINVYEKNDNIGSIAFDAQRLPTIKSHRYSENIGEKSFPMVFDYDRNPIAGAADCMISREVLEKIFPWNEYNVSHEGGQDSETHMLNKIRSIMNSEDIKWTSVVPLFPVAAAIYTDFRGTNARVRNNKRYGDYWAPKKDDFRYYKIKDFNSLEVEPERNYPYSIEEVVNAIGWDKEDMLDENGIWKKNPIRPEMALDDDFVDLEAA